ncbi:MAG: 50S ribosomal protein L9 [Planctomycetota bacterium]|nr:MAG: 50S ribosomal protein L9 [Planctomycetota bacterium]
MKTRVILRDDIPALGDVGDVVEVSPGYARNHLIPLGLAYPYGGDGMQRVGKDRKRAAERRAAMQAEFEALTARLGTVQLTFEEKVSEEGHLYGSVSAARIAGALVDQGLNVTERNVRLAEPIRSIGEYEVPVHIHGELEAKVKVWVVASKPAEAGA